MFLTQQLSNRQYTLLRECQDTGGITLERMLEISQTTGGSIVKRGFVKWDRGIDHFTLTPEGLDLMKHFEHSEIGRGAIDRPLSSAILARNKELVSLSKSVLEHNHQLVRERKKIEEAREEAMTRAQKRAKSKTTSNGKG